MRRIAGLLGVSLCAIMGLAACDTSKLTGPSGLSLEARPPGQTVATANAGTLNGPRPVTGQLEGSDEYGDTCGNGQGVTVVSTGIGTVSHFGNAVMVSTICVDLSDFSVIGPAPYSLKAANGDEAGGFVTDVTFTSYGFDLYTSITWGTGRFEGATGELVFPTVSTGTGMWSSEVKGWITY